MAIRLGRGGERIAPTPYQDAVELYARKSNRHARIEEIPALRMWQIRFTPMPNDPRMLLVQQGKMAVNDLEECVQIQRPAKETFQGREIMVGKPVELDELGVEGLIQWLEQHDTFSGRGKYKSVEDARKKTAEANQAHSDKVRQETVDDGVQLGMDVRRQIFKIPFHQVGIDLQTKEQ